MPRAGATTAPSVAGAADERRIGERSARSAFRADGAARAAVRRGAPAEPRDRARSTASTRRPRSSAPASASPTPWQLEPATPIMTGGARPRHPVAVSAC